LFFDDGAKSAENGRQLAFFNLTGHGCTEATFRYATVPFGTHYVTCINEVHYAKVVTFAQSTNLSTDCFDTLGCRPDTSLAEDRESSETTWACLERNADTKVTARYAELPSHPASRGPKQEDGHARPPQDTTKAGTVGKPPGSGNPSRLFAGRSQSDFTQFWPSH
jgi:hypothetical protein